LMRVSIYDLKSDNITSNVIFMRRIYFWGLGNSGTGIAFLGSGPIWYVCELRIKKIRK
jgi:hypothetical protein